MEAWIVPVTSVISSLMVSGGFWAYIQKRELKRTASNHLLLGLAHDRIIHLGMTYIERGWLTKDEYEDFMKYLYKPYAEAGGNGLAEKVMMDVTKLKIYARHRPTNTTPIKVITTEVE